MYSLDSSRNFCKLRLFQLIHELSLMSKVHRSLSVD